MSYRVKKNALARGNCARLLVAGASSSALAFGVYAQEPPASGKIEQAPAAAVGEQLPEVQVTTATSAKPRSPKARAKKSTQATTTTTVQQSAPITVPTVGEGQVAGNEADKPGLNLSNPASSGSRLNLSPLETPASVEVIPAQAIRDRGQQSVGQAITQNATGFTSTAASGNGGTALAARGFTGHGSVMQLYDGTRLYVGAGTVTFPFDTWSADRIEVLRGPASVIYGEGAIGGVINVLPKKPTDYSTHEAEVAIGTDATKRFGLGSGGPIRDQLSYRFDASGIKSDGWLDDESDFSSLALSGALRYRATPDLTFSISHDYGNQSPLRYWGTPLIDGRIQSAQRFKSFNVKDSDINYLDNWTQLKTEWTPTDQISVRNTAYRLSSQRHWKNVEGYDFQKTGANAGLIRRSDYIEIFHDQEQVGNRFDASLSTDGFGIKNQISVGFDVNKIDFLHTNNSPFGGQSFVDPFNPILGNFINLAGTTPRFETDTFQYAFFAEDRLTLSKELSLIGGIRLDRPTVEREELLTGTSFEKEFSNVTWRTGVVYTPLPGLAFYGQYATGVDPVGGIVTLSQSNINFDLATGRQIEIGVKQSFWGGLGELTLAGYDIAKEDLLARNPNNSQIVEQVGQQSSRGVELSVALQLSEALRFEGNAAVLEAQYDDFVQRIGGLAVNLAGKRPNNVPEQIVNGWLTWAFMPQWEARIGAQWVGNTFNDDANLIERPDLTVVNLGLDYAVTDSSKISVRGFNVFDEVYATGGNSTEWNLAPPRAAEISYRVKY